MILALGMPINMDTAYYNAIECAILHVVIQYALPEKMFAKFYRNNMNVRMLLLFEFIFVASITFFSFGEKMFMIWGDTITFRIMIFISYLWPAKLAVNIEEWMFGLPIKARSTVIDLLVTLGCTHLF